MSGISHCLGFWWTIPYFLIFCLIWTFRFSGPPTLLDWSTVLCLKITSASHRGSPFYRRHTADPMNGFQHQPFASPQYNLLCPSHMHNTWVPLYSFVIGHYTWALCFFSFNAVYVSYTAATYRDKIACNTISILLQSILPHKIIL